jgi:16S rRNA (cytosine967-C5)-methyltransferase
VETEARRLPRLDWIVIDAPCSNTGVLARRPEARYRIRHRSLRGLSGIQTELLETAASLARTRTRLLYSTCSLEPEENEQVVQAFCRSHPAWALMDSRLTFPQAGAEWWDWRDGGYWAVLGQGES